VLVKGTNVEDASVAKESKDASFYQTSPRVEPFEKNPPSEVSIPEVPKLSEPLHEPREGQLLLPLEPRDFSH
jgi:hypothetical protein